jgi:hypothetical protein
MGGTHTRTGLDESSASTKDQLDEATSVAPLQSTKSAPASSPRRSRSAAISGLLGFTNNLRVARALRIARVHEQPPGFPSSFHHDLRIARVHKQPPGCPSSPDRSGPRTTSGFPELVPSRSPDRSGSRTTSGLPELVPSRSPDRSSSRTTSGFLSSLCFPPTSGLPELALLRPRTFLFERKIC